MGRRAQYGVVAFLFCLLVRGALSASGPVGLVYLTPGWATFGQAVPQGQAVVGLQVGSLPTQTDVKNRWPDGSIRFAIVTAAVDAEGQYPVTAAAASVGTFTPSPRNISVTLTIAGVPHVANAPSGGDPWLQGPLVNESRQVIAPVAATGPHPFLRVNFDTRRYNDGDARFDVSVENMLNLVGATTVTYDVAIIVDGVTVFTRDAVEHYYLTRWRQSFNFGEFAAVTPDIAALNLTRALPPYLPLVANHVNDATGPLFDILKEGALDRNMPAHGGRPELAPYPDWTARYLVHKDPRQKVFVLAHGDLSGSWPVHVREPEIPEVDSFGTVYTGEGNERLVSLQQRPTVWFDGRARDLVADGIDYIRGTPMPIREYGDTTPGPGQSGLIPDNAHQPSLAYVPYLLTGDRYYAEEMAFWANYGMLRTSPGDGVRGSMGILENQETRGYAWALRTLVDAAAYYPDASPVRNYLTQRVLANLQFLDTYANAQDPVTNPFRVLWLGYRSSQDAGFIALWEQNYLAWSIDRANKQGFAGGLDHRDAIARLQLALFNSPDYPRSTILETDTTFADGTFVPAGTQLDWGAPYLLNVATVPDPERSWENPTYFTTMSEVAAGTQEGPTRFDRWRPYAGYYGPEARLNLMIGVEGGWSGAQGAYDYLFPFIGIQNAACSFVADGSDRPDLACRAGWALDFYPNPAAGEPDADSDTVPDATDNCPAVANPLQENYDGDASGDACDADDDNDGVDDAVEIAAGSNPKDPASTPELCDGIDNDLDGVIDDTFPNSDGDALADCVDPDDDNDGRPDGLDPLPLVPNRAPSIDSPGAQMSTIGVAIAPLPIVALDLDGDPLQWSALGLPSGLAIDQSGVVTGTPAADASYENTVSVSISDGLAVASTTFAWAINNTGVGDGVTVVTPDAQITFSSVSVAGQTSVVPAAPPEPGLLPAGFTVAGLPTYEITSSAQFTGPVVVCLNVASLNLSQAAFDLLRILHGEGGSFVDRTILAPNTPAPDFATGRICAGVTTLSPFSLASLVPVNRAPELSTPATQQSAEGETILLPITTTDADGDTVTLTAAGLPLGLGVVGYTISGTLGFSSAGDYRVTLTASDGELSTSASFDWRVANTNRAPVVSPLAPPPATVGVAIAPVTITATDEDGDPLTYSAAGLPPGLAMPAGSQTISGVPTTAGNYNVTVTVTDGTSPVSQSFAWIVQPAVQIYLRNPGAQTSSEGDRIRLRLTWNVGAGENTRKKHDPTFSATSLPKNLHIGRNGEIFGHLGKRAEGHYHVTVTMHVGSEHLSQSFDWTVLPTNRTPRLLRHGHNRKSKVGESIHMPIRAFDPDLDRLTFTVTNLPPGLSVTDEGVISGVITGDGGTYRVSVTASDGLATDVGTFEWVVVKKNQAPRPAEKKKKKKR